MEGRRGRRKRWTGGEPKELLLILSVSGRDHPVFSNSGPCHFLITREAPFVVLGSETEHKHEEPDSCCYAGEGKIWSVSECVERHQ